MEKFSQIRPGLEKLFANIKALLRKKHILVSFLLLFVIIVGSTFYITTMDKTQVTTQKVVHEKEVKTPAETAKPDVTGTTTLTDTEEKVNTAAKTLEISSLKLPVDAATPTREFGFNYSETFKDYRFHSGVDFKGEKGTPVKAALEGTVENIIKTREENYTIIIDHGSGWKTKYSHLGEPEVKKGDKVKAGEKIGRIGEPGENELAEGPHLHFELLHNETHQNPLEYLGKR